MKKVSVIVAVLIAIFFISCKGPMGPIGPEGPQGEAGPTGSQGPTGNANVKTYLYRNQTWFNWSNSSIEYVLDFTIPALTTGFDTTGAVLVYMKSANSYWLQIPWGSTDGSVTYQYGVFLGPGLLRVDCKSSDGSTFNSPYYTDFKIILIQGNLANKKILESIDTKNYNEVKQAFNIEE